MIVLIGIQICNKNMVNILLWSGFLSLFNYSQVILPSFQAALLLPTHPQKTLDIDLLLLSSYFFPAPDPLFRPLIQGFHLHLDLLLGFDRWPDIKKKATDWAKLNFSSQSRTWSPPLYWCNPPHFPLSFWGGDENKKKNCFHFFSLLNLGFKCSYELFRWLIYSFAFRKPAFFWHFFRKHSRTKKFKIRILKILT